MRLVRKRFRAAGVGLTIALTIALMAGVAHADPYLKLFGGWSNPRDQDFELTARRGSLGQSSGLDFDGGFLAGVALGFSPSPTFGIEAEYVYREADADLKNTSDTSGGSMKSNAFMVNALYDFPALGALRPYAGAGIGVGDLSLNLSELKFDSNYKFAYQGIIGIIYDASNQASLFSEIRYFSIFNQIVKSDDYEFNTNFDSIDVIIGYAYLF